MLDFAPSTSVGGVGNGTVLFVPQGVAMPMGSWLRSCSATAGMRGRLERTFRCSDGEEYRWAHRADTEAEWAVRLSFMPVEV